MINFMPIISEHAEQALLFRWMSYVPELEFAFAIPNAAKRGKWLASRMKAEGLKSGVPDVMIPLARHGYHGLFIEMKSDKGNVSSTQRKYLDFLTEEGYRAKVCKGFEEAKREIEWYLEKIPSGEYEYA